MNPRRLTPSMSLLLSFEAAARHRSFTRAAEELAMTQSAISKQVQSLEELIGVELFVRSGRKIELTDVGAAYLRELTGALGAIRNATLQAIAFRNGGGSLHLAVLPTFGSKWLLPRLHGFYAQHTGVQLHIHSRIGRVDLDKSGMDAYIGVGDGHWPGSTSHLLLNEELVPIISPELAASAPVTSAADLCTHLLLQVTARPDTWAQWFHARGVAPNKMRLGPQFELTSHLIQAVAAGIGVGLVPRYFINDELKAGTLAIALDDTLPGNLGYYLVYPTDRATYPPLVALRDWLLGVVEET